MAALNFPSSPTLGQTHTENGKVWVWSGYAWVTEATGLTANDIGVTVQGYDTDIPTVSASQAEMEAGTEAALRSMSPLGVKQAIDSLAPDTASEIANVPAGNIAATDVQAALNELDTEKLPNTTSLTEIGAALVDADEIPVYDTSAAGNRKSLLSRIWTYISGKLASPPAIGGTTPADAKFVNLEYTGTLTGGTGVINLGSGQVYKNAAGDVGLGTTTPNIYNVGFAGAYRGNFYSLVATNQGATNTSALLNLSALAAGSSSIVFGNETDQRGQISVNSSSALSLWTRDSDTGFLTERLTVNNAGATTLTGNLSVTGNTTLGDASGDTVSLQAGTAALPTLIPNGDPNTGLWFPAADTIAASTAGSERLRIDYAGNVGIGTSSLSSQSKFTVYADASPSSTTYALWLRGGSAGVGNDGGGIAFSTAVASTITNPSLAATAIRSLNSYGSESNGEQGDLAFYTNRRTGANTYTGLTERLRIDYAGNLLLRQSSNAASTSVSFNTTIQNALTLDASGNLGIGTAATTWNYQNKNLVLYDSISSGVQVTNGTNTAQVVANTLGVYVGSRNAVALNLVVTDSTRISVSTAGVVTFNNYGAGTLATNSSGVISASDGRYKTKTRNVESGLRAVLKLEPTYYRWHEESPFYSQYEELGFIAQEVAAVIPEASPEPESDGKYKNYSDRAVLAMLVKSIQELHAEIETLKQRIN